MPRVLHEQGGFSLAKSGGELRSPRDRTGHAVIHDPGEARTIPGEAGGGAMAQAVERHLVEGAQDAVCVALGGNQVGDGEERVGDFHLLPLRFGDAGHLKRASKIGADELGALERLIVKTVGILAVNEEHQRSRSSLHMQRHACPGLRAQIPQERALPEIVRRAERARAWVMECARGQAGPSGGLPADTAGAGRGGSFPGRVDLYRLRRNSSLWVLARHDGVHLQQLRRAAAPVRQNTIARRFAAQLLHHPEHPMLKLLTLDGTLVEARVLDRHGDLVRDDRQGAHILPGKEGGARGHQADEAAQGERV